jgi:hypothetical protein
MPARGPPTVGANATCIVHAAFTATVLTQLLLPGTIFFIASETFSVSLVKSCIT